MYAARSEPTVMAVPPHVSPAAVPPMQHTAPVLERLELPGQQKSGKPLLPELSFQPLGQSPLSLKFIVVCASDPLAIASRIREEAMRDMLKTRIRLVKEEFQGV